MDDQGILRVAQLLLQWDYDANRASSPDWDGLIDSTQEQYLLRARQIVAAYTEKAPALDP